MNRVLLLGFSSIARRRVLPALAKLGVAHVDVASRSATASVELPAGMDGRVYADYGMALHHSQAELVYVSTVNSLHAELAAAALESGHHVVLDKPATICLADTRRLLSMARSKGRLLAEATVYTAHPQIAAAQNVFAESNSYPTRIVATFQFPPLPPDNYRHRVELGGGALWDLGPYAVTPGRLFFGQAPTEVVCRASTPPGAVVEGAFSMLALYPGNRSFVGQYGTGTGYINRLDLLGPDVTVSVDRVFTPPADWIAALAVNQQNVRRTLTVPAADSFGCFLQAVFDALERGAFQPFADAMLTDALALHQLHAAAGVESERSIATPP